MCRILVLVICPLLLAGVVAAEEKPADLVVPDNDSAVLLQADDDQQPRARVLQLPGRRVSGTTPGYLAESDDLCLTMHSIYVRQRRGTDQTSTTGQRTCTPGNRFHLRYPAEQK